MVLPGASRYFPDFWLPAKNSSPTSSIWKKRMNGSRAFLRWAGESYARAAPQKAVRADLPRPTHNSLLSMSGTNIGAFCYRTVFLFLMKSQMHKWHFVFWPNKEGWISSFDPTKRGKFWILTQQKGGNFISWPNEMGEILHRDPMKRGKFWIWIMLLGQYFVIWPRIASAADFTWKLIQLNN